jgi:hypothetical protein
MADPSPAPLRSKRARWILPSDRRGAGKCLKIKSVLLYPRVWARDN